jgi:hypothetical protein
MIMNYQAEFTGWQNITLEDLVVAYRKAKADCFFENNFPAVIKFAEYEQNLFSLKTNKGFVENEDYLGEFPLLPQEVIF